MAVFCAPDSLLLDSCQLDHINALLSNTDLSLSLTIVTEPNNRPVSLLLVYGETWRAPGNRRTHDSLDVSVAH